MKFRTGFLAAASLTFAAGLAGAQPQSGDSFDAHTARAKALAGKDYPKALYRGCVREAAAAAAPARRGANGAAPPAPPPAPEPAKIFDNLYYVGAQSVSAWAVTTSQGIIIIDALDNGQEAKDDIDGGLRKLGLNPNDIKYVIITHGHIDHYGGANYLKTAHGARLITSKIDWDFMAQGKKPRPDGTKPSAERVKLIPDHDMDAVDGGKITLGDTTIRTYITPGHTPGTLSLLIPVKDNGAPHLAALYGGIGFNFEHTPENLKLYQASADRFTALSKAAGADVVISNHPFNNDNFAKIAALKTRAPGGPNPFVVGKEVASHFTMVLSECAQAVRSSISERKAKT